MSAIRRTVLVLALAAGLAGCEGASEAELDTIGRLLEVREGTAVADVGAGDGVLLRFLADAVGNTGRVFGTEIDPARIAALEALVAQEDLDRVRIVTATATETGLPDACCDAVVLRHVYHHLTDPVPTLAGLHRALRGGGRLLVIDFEPTALLAPWAPDDVPADRTGHGVLPDVVVREAQAAGFTHVSTVADWPGGHWPMAHFAVLLSKAREP